MAKMFPKAGFGKVGYRINQVEEFFDLARTQYEQGGPFTASQVRAAAFDLVRGGYDTLAVDEALDRVEVAFAVRERLAYVEQHGQDAWMAEVASRATALYPRLTRPPGKRFRPPARGKGYDAEAVDAVLERLVDYFDRGRPISTQDLRTVTFPAAPAKYAYDEGPVDAFLDRAIDILLAVE